MLNQQGKIVDPIQLGKLLWPEVTFYSRQQEIIYSVLENDETIVPAANVVGVCPLS